MPKPLHSLLLGVAFQGTRGVAAAFDAKIFYSSDSGTNWTQTLDSIANPRTVAMSSNGSIAYAGTEENGIYLSKNSGEKWEQLRPDPENINRIRLDTKDANLLWVATEKTGVWTLTIGTNRLLQKKEGLSNAGLAVWDFAFDNSGNIYAATFDGVYKSDGLNAWKEFGLQGKELLSLEIVGNQLYAGARRNPDNARLESGVWRRELADNASWQEVSPPDWKTKYTVRDLLYVDSCQGPLAATNDGVWVYR